MRKEITMENHKEFGRAIQVILQLLMILVI